MTDEVLESRTTGLWGPVAVFGGALLLLLSPLMRGGNRFIALVPLEFLGLLILTALWARFVLRPRELQHHPVIHSPLLAPLLLSPLLLALVQLVPLPADWWARLPAHAVYVEALGDAGFTAGGARPVSLSPDATSASLLAAIPLVAAFLLAYGATLPRLRLLLRVVVLVAFAQVLFGLMQISGGQHSPLFFGVLSFGPPVGTFANRNHFANYIAMALAAYVWLAYEALHGSRRQANITRKATSFTNRHATALWVAGGLVLVLGILMSRSRGAALFGLTMAMLALGAAALRITGWSRGVRFAVPVTLGLMIGAAALIGFDATVSRISGEQLTASAGFRGALARTSFEGALAFWPWGSGWGTYDLAYQRFQPPVIAGYANHVHNDYIEMLFEGGMFFLLFAGMFLWLAGKRAWLLLRTAWREKTLGRDAMAATLCGLGLLGLMLHSLVEFNLRIPANAILGALLAGAYLRPLSTRRNPDDRPAQPHPPRHRRRLDQS